MASTKPPYSSVAPSDPTSESCDLIQSSVGWRPKSVDSLDFTCARSMVVLIIIKCLMETDTSIKSYHKKRRNQK